MSNCVSAVASTVMVSVCRCTRHPKCCKISTAVSTSAMFGQLCILHVPGQRMQAAKMGSTLFFAP